jgi:hypothetical protein
VVAGGPHERYGSGQHEQGQALGRGDDGVRSETHKHIIVTTYQLIKLQVIQICWPITVAVRSEAWVLAD